MDPETEKIIKTQIEKLPIEIRNLFADPGLGDKILNIGRKNGIMNIEQLGVFQTETNLMILGLVHPDEYPSELKDRLKIDNEKVNAIVNDVNTQILSGIREKLKEIYEKSDEAPNGTEESEEQSFKTPSKTLIEETPMSKAGFDSSEKPIESREELLRKIEHPDLLTQKELPAGNIKPARDAFGIADAGGELKEKPLPVPVKNTPKDTILGDIALGDKKDTSSILAQKLSGSFQIPMTQTEHTLENLSPNSKPSITPKVDPYRETLD